MNQIVVHQGNKAAFIYVVLEGEFEILRNQKPNFTKLNPINASKYKKAYYMDTEEISELMGKL